MHQIKQEFRRIVLCHQLWLKTEVDEIQRDKNYAEHKCLACSIFADPDHP